MKVLPVGSHYSIDLKFGGLIYTKNSH